MDVRKDYTGVHAALAYEKAEAIAQEYTERYLAGEVDAVFLAYNEFKSAITQKPVVVQLLPIETPAAAAGRRGHRLQVRAVARGAARATCSPATSRCRSGARSSSPPRASTARA